MKRSKEKITLSILLAAVLVVGIVGYMIYVQHQFYTESTKNLLETYEQVDKTFTMFAQRNWNVLSEWGSNLQDDADGEGGPGQSVPVQPTEAYMEIQRPVLVQRRLHLSGCRGRLWLS